MKIIGHRMTQQHYHVPLGENIVFGLIHSSSPSLKLRRLDLPFFLSFLTSASHGLHPVILCRITFLTRTYLCSNRCTFIWITKTKPCSKMQCMS